MAGTYTHTSRATGTILTPFVYNGDHGNHATNEVPLGYDDYSVDAAQMKLTTNPYPGGVESQPTSLAGELERIRYVLRQIKMDVSTGREWYQPDHVQGDPIFRQVFSED